MSLKNNIRGAYHSFAATEIEVIPEPRQEYRASNFREAVKETTYAPSFEMDKSLQNRILLKDGA